MNEGMSGVMSGRKILKDFGGDKAPRRPYISSHLMGAILG